MLYTTWKLLWTRAPYSQILKLRYLRAYLLIKLGERQLALEEIDEQQKLPNLPEEVRTLLSQLRTEASIE